MTIPLLALVSALLAIVSYLTKMSGGSHERNDYSHEADERGRYPGP